jgi:hypothetical protein
MALDASSFEPQNTKEKPVHGPGQCTGFSTAGLTVHTTFNQVLYYFWLGQGRSVTQV